MKREPIAIGLLLTLLLTGCATGAMNSSVVIETAAPEPGETDYARALALQLQNERTTHPAARSAFVADATLPRR